MNEVKSQYEEHNKSIYHIIKCNISIVQRMKGLPRIIGRQEEEHNDSAVKISSIIIILLSSGAMTQPTITRQWYSGTTAQPTTTSKAVLDLSGATNQPAYLNVQRNSALKGIRLNMYA
ncbi:hypothetical protein F511_08866 [Dorcoceras hygrometricum]|uniref:Uncharacterized protein n=1 Tax=Dorcoceras hygrometricum TaxID=472368 RepID=A0A2Z7AN65_9LAMI|nr:hypothetical protein F511_08866 [Dorcoceras hygrometricum]